MSEVSSERRKLARRRQLKAGTIALNNRSSTVSCTVRDLTEVGAKLKFDGTPVPNDTFVLIIDIDHSEYDCTVIWRSARELGVRFLADARKVSTGRAQVIAPIARPSAVTLRKRPAQTNL